MSVWKQVLLSLVVIALIGVAWFFYFPGARDVLSRFGLNVGASSASASAPTASAGRGGFSGRGGFAGRGGFGGRTTQVVTRAAETGILNDRLSALGNGVALHSVTVVPGASGTLTALLVKSGATVRAGDVIGRLESESQKIAYDKAKLALSDAQTTLERTKQLNAAHTVAASQVQSAELAVSNAELGVRNAEFDLKNRTITAPIDGTIGIIQVDAGNAVTTQTTIATIEDRSALLVSFWVPERFMGAIKPGDPLEATVVSRPQEVVKGTVSAVDNKIDSASGTFEVQARVPNPKDDLRAGMSFTVNMNFPGDSFVAVDPLAIQWGSDGAYVWRVVDGKAQKAAIRIVQRNTESVLVAGDVKAGDEIVTEGLEGLRDGQAVQLAGADTAQAGQPPAAKTSGRAPAAAARPSRQVPAASTSGQRTGQRRGARPASQSSGS